MWFLMEDTSTRGNSESEAEIIRKSLSQCLKESNAFLSWSSLNLQCQSSGAYK